jgi:hypothetical protein
MIWSRKSQSFQRIAKQVKEKQPAIKKEEVRRNCAWKDVQRVRQKSKHCVCFSRKSFSEEWIHCSLCKEGFHENYALMEGLADIMYVTYCGNNCLEGATFLRPELPAEIENSNF